MLASEYPEFETIVRRLEKLFAKKLDDESIQVYWRSLKDQKLDVFKRFVARHERFGKFFPKPSELRAKEDKLPDVQGGKNDATFKEGEARCIANLEDLHKRDPAKWEAEVKLRRLDRVIATEPQYSPIYARALCEWREARGIKVGAAEWAEVGGR